MFFLVGDCFVLGWDLVGGIVVSVVGCDFGKGFDCFVMSVVV